MTVVVAPNDRVFAKVLENYELKEKLQSSEDKYIDLKDSSFLLKVRLNNK